MKLLNAKINWAIDFFFFSPQSLQWTMFQINDNKITEYINNINNNNNEMKWKRATIKSIQYDFLCFYVYLTVFVWWMIALVCMCVMGERENTCLCTMYTCMSGNESLDNGNNAKQYGTLITYENCNAKYHFGLLCMNKSNGWNEESEMI